MAKLEQRKGLYGGFKPGSTGGPGTGKFKNTVKRISNNIKRKAGDIASNIKNNKETKKPTLAINTDYTSDSSIGYENTNPSDADRYIESTQVYQPIANPNAYAATLAGGSRPMTAMNNPQVDPMTGMPITPGGQPNMNPNFIGGMANSNIPTTGMLAQEKSTFENLKGFGKNVISDLHKAGRYIERIGSYDPNKSGPTKIPQESKNKIQHENNHLNNLNDIENKMQEEKYREELINTDEGKRINEALGVNYTPNPNPAKNYDKGFEPFGRLSGQAKTLDSRKINGATVLGGNQPTKKSGLGAVVSQEKYDAAKADVNGNGVTEDWEEANAKKFTVAQEKSYMRTMKPLPPAVPDRSDSTAMFMGGNAPGQYNNPIWKPAADSAKVRFPNINPDKIKSSDIYKKGNQLHEITRHIPIVNKRYGTEESSKKAFDEAMIDQQRLTQSRRGTKCMRVKKR